MSDIGSDIRPRRRRRGRPFVKGQSGNPAGRRPGCRNKATLAAEALLDGEAEGLSRLALARAFAGSDLALKLCLDRILAPRRERFVHFAMPPIRDAGDLAAAAGAITAAVAAGALTPGEACDLAQVTATFIRAIETSDFRAPPALPRGAARKRRRARHNRCANLAVKPLQKQQTVPGFFSCGLYPGRPCGAAAERAGGPRFLL